MAKLTSCPNGHFYDGDRFDHCPYCAQPERTTPLFHDQPEDTARPPP